MRHWNVLLVGLLVVAWGAQAERARLPDVGVPGGLGVNIHFTNPRPGEMEMLAAAGFKWVRMDLNWGGTEREQAQYDFGAYDRLMAALEPHGIRAIFILDYSNKLYDGGVSPYTDEGREAMGRWAVAAAKHFAGKRIIFEMWNEPNIGFWKPKPNADDYAKLALAVGKAMRAGAPDELYVGPATSTIDLKFLETCFKAGCLEYWDAVSVHPYRQSGPETVEAEYRKLRALIARYAPKGKAIPIISGEWGYSTGWKGFDEVRQGKYLSREFLVNLCNDVPVSIFYDWHDDGTDPKESEHHFGTVRNAYVKDRDPVYEPKPSYIAMKELATELGGLSFNKRLWVGDEGDWVAVFSKGETVKLAAWTTSKTPRTVTLPVSAGKFTVVREGKREAAEAGAKGLKLELTDTVAYLAPEGKNDLLAIAAAWERLRPDGSGGLEVRNPLERSIRLLGLNPDNEVEIDGGDATRIGWYLEDPKANRSPEPRWVTRELKLSQMGVVTQRVSYVSPDPLVVEAFPPTKEGLPVRIGNPSGTRFVGRLNLVDAVGIELARTQLPVRLEDGQYERTLTFPLKGAGAREWSIGLDLHDAGVGKQPVVSVPRRTYRAVAVDFKVRSDGDGKVTSAEVTDSAAPPEPAPVSGPVVRLKYEMEAGWRFEQVMPATDEGRRIEGKPTLLGMWVYGDGSGCQIRARFIDADGQTLQPDGPRVDWKGWRWVTLPMSGGTTAHWGKGDGEVHYPIRWDTVLLLDNVSKRKVSGEIWVGGVMTVE